MQVGDRVLVVGDSAWKNQEGKVIELLPERARVDLDDSITLIFWTSELEATISKDDK